ncbi:hypothetical protein E2C01_052779 [Portunus trituberculatus]|uniref:Uncharacterized protein n=1 Tax=Portunus trituberculatus TaxID=210409 RepID=A0A5B7GEL7_PORTR|nr:hypothetical protein [Portunus trituberculatus]
MISQCFVATQQVYKEARVAYREEAARSVYKSPEEDSSEFHLVACPSGERRAPQVRPRAWGCGGREAQGRAAA